MKKYLILSAAVVLALTTQAQTNYGSSTINQTSGSTPTLFKNSGTELMRIQPNGNVGIGTNNPAYKLDVNGDIHANNFYGNINTTSGTTQLNNLIVSRIKPLPGDTFVLVGDSSLKLGDNYIRWTTTTNLGGLAIGNGSTLAFPNNSIAIGQNVRVIGEAANAMVIGRGNGGGNGQRLENSIANSLWIGFNSTQPTLYVGNSLGGSTTGNVGIGTTNVSYKLQVAGITASQQGIFVDLNNASDGTLDNNSLKFGGSGTGEGIASRRVSGSNQHGLDFYTSFTSRLSITNGGFIGIGTNSPGQKLEVNGNISVNSNILMLKNNNDYNHGIRYAGTTSGSGFAGVDVTNGIDGPAIYGFAGGVLGTKDLGGSTEKIVLRWNSNGSVQIGDVTTPNVGTTNGYLLYVQKGILTERVKIALKTSTDWMDMVFDEKYDLMPLLNVESFIKSNKHLPGIPSANTLVNEGLDVAKMQALQMQKIEELTLYIIELQKQIDELKK